MGRKNSPKWNDKYCRLALRHSWPNCLRHCGCKRPGTKLMPGHQRPSGRKTPPRSMGMYVLTVNERTKIVWESGQKSPHTDDFFIIAGFIFSTWWRHEIETFSALLATCVGNSPVPGEFPAQRPVTRSFDVFFDLRLNKRLSKQSWGWWFGTLSLPLWRHRNAAKTRYGR